MNLDCINNIQLYREELSSKEHRGMFIGTFLKTNNGFEAVFSVTT